MLIQNYRNSQIKLRLNNNKILSSFQRSCLIKDVLLFRVNDNDIVFIVFAHTGIHKMFETPTMRNRVFS